MVVVAMVRYWWSSDGDVADVDCCYGGNCYNFFNYGSICGVGNGGGVAIGFGGSILAHHHH